MADRWILPAYGQIHEDATQEWILPGYGQFQEAGALAYTLSCAAGTYAVSGTAASLEYGPAIDAASGTYSLSGTAASLEFGRKLAAASGSYAWTGTAATLTYGAITGTPGTGMKLGPHPISLGG